MAEVQQAKTAIGRALGWAVDLLSEEWVEVDFPNLTEARAGAICRLEILGLVECKRRCRVSIAGCDAKAEFSAVVYPDNVRLVALINRDVYPQVVAWRGMPANAFTISTLRREYRWTAEGEDFAAIVAKPESELDETDVAVVEWVIASMLVDCDDLDRDTRETRPKRLDRLVSPVEIIAPEAHIATGDRLAALVRVRDELDRWNVECPTVSGETLESIDKGHPLYAAIGDLRSFYGGRLPRPAITHWRGLLKATRNDRDGERETEADAHADKLTEWVEKEIAAATPLLQAESPKEKSPEFHQPAGEGNRTRWTQESAQREIDKYLKANPNAGPVEVQKHVGCSTGLVYKCKPFCDNKRAKKPRKAKKGGLDLLASSGGTLRGEDNSRNRDAMADELDAREEYKRHAILELLEEQLDDYEPSPLDDRPAKPPRANPEI